MNNSNPNPDDAQAQIPTLIRALHRGKGANVAFLAPDAEGEIKPLGACPIEELEQHENLIESRLNDTLYLTINSTATGKGATAAGLKYALMEDYHTRFLNAVPADLDIGRIGENGAACMSIEEAKFAVWELINKGKIPQPSLLIESGRGLWLLFLLHDRDDPAKPPKAHDQTTSPIYRAISEELANRLKHLGADPRAINTGRFFRVPHSTNPKSGKRVQWHYLTNKQGQTPSYSLDELAQKLEVKSEPRAKRRGAFYGSRTIKNRGISPLRINGKIERARRRCNDIEKVSVARGGFEEGHRWHVLTTYAHLLRAAEVSDDQLKARVDTLAAECRPPFPSSKSDGTTAQIVKNAIDRTHPEHNFKEATLFQRLKLTEKEARHLELVSILTPEIRAEQAQNKRDSSRTGQLEARLTAIKAILEAFPSVSASECQSALESQGLPASLKTVKRNLNDIAPDRQKPVNQHTQSTNQANELHPPPFSKRCDPALLDTLFIWNPVEATTSLPGKPETFYPLLLAGISAKNRETPSYLESIYQIGRPVRDG